MLTAELVCARRRKGKLELIELTGEARNRAVGLARAYLELARAHVGRRRGELEEAMNQVGVAPRDTRMAAGLRKLVLDRCTIEAVPALDPAALRRQLFQRAAARRRELAGTFDRELVLAELAAEHGLAAGALEEALYADLRDQHLVREVAAIGPRDLVEHHAVAQAQAVLLRAVQVTAQVRCSRPADYRTLMAKLKFRRLLYRLEPGEDGGYAVVIDGPLSMFSSATRYGLQLALLLPAIQTCDEWRISAELRWGKRREPLQFTLSGQGRPESDADEAPLPEEVAALAARFAQLDTAWQVAPAEQILDLPGVGLCVPDLRFTHGRDGHAVFLEVLGFWSRDAVWRRVELVERGLDTPILFAVSSRLRVSEAALDESLPGALYVYKGAMSAPRVAEHLDQLVARHAGGRPLRASRGR